MAANFTVNMAKGDEKADITIADAGTIAGAGHIEMTVDDTGFNSASDLAQHLRIIANRIEEGIWPPA